MKKLSLLLLALGMFTFIGCSDEEMVDTNLVVQLTYEGEPLTMFTEVNFPDGQKMRFSRVSMYLNEFKLKGEEDHQLFDIEYINLTSSHDSEVKSAEGFVMTFQEVPTGDYTGVSFNIGVPTAQNAMTPEEFGNDEALSNQAEYWPGWKSYIFTKTEGDIDMQNNGEFSGFSLHTGSDQAFQSVSLSKSFEIKENGDAVTLVLEMKDVFEQDGSVYDIINHPQTHSLEQQDQVNEISRNYAKAFSLK